MSAVDDTELLQRARAVDPEVVREARGGDRRGCGQAGVARPWGRRCACCGFTLFLVAAPGFAQAAELSAAAARSKGESPANAADPELAESSEGFLEAARAGLSDFEAGRHETALGLFERALLHPSHSLDRATLLFNMGVCLLALGRFDDAEQRFLESTPLDPSAAGMARLQAGFAALGAGRIEDAKHYLAAVRGLASAPGDDAADDANGSGAAAEADSAVARSDAAAAEAPAEAPGSADDDGEVRQGAAKLEAAIEERESALAVEARLGRCAELAERGAAELGRREYLRAQRTLESALALADDMQPAARANLRHGAAVAAYRRADLVAARGHIEQAIADSPKNPELRILHASILLRLGDAPGARRSARHAAELGADPGELDDLDSEVQAASPLPRSGWSGHLTALGGWDSNPAQSGLGAEGGLSSDSGDSGSAMVSTFGGVALTGRSGEHSALRLEYTVDWLGLLETSVEELSAQSHGLGARWYHELGQRWLLRFGAGGTVRLVGFDSPEMMSYGLNLGAALTLDPKRDLSTELEVRVTSTEGLGEYEYLGGTRLDGRIEQRWLTGPVELEVGVGARYVGLGTIVFDVSGEQFPGCRGRRCDAASYTVPLSYAGPRVDLGVSVDVVGSLAIRLATEGEYREYLEASMISGETRSRKLRRDWRWRLSAESELGLGKSEHFALLAEYAVLGASSNVDYDATDPEHDLDYGNYSFVQHLVEAGVSARF